MPKLDKRLQFEKIYRTCEKDLQGFIFTLTRNDSFAMEEILQNTMLEALKALPNLRDSRKMKSWIFSIAKTESKRFYTSHLYTHRHEYKKISNFESASAKSSDFTADIANADLIRTLINDLSEEEQQTCVLHYYYGMTLKKISDLLQKNYNTVRSLHARGITKLRKKIYRKGEF